MKLNDKAACLMIRALLSGMTENGSGSITDVSSAASSVTAAPNRFMYGTAKVAVTGTTQSVAADFIAQGILRNAICPGTAESSPLRDWIRAIGGYAAASGAFIARQPIGRIGKPEEIAALAVCLASEDSARTAGVARVIDGG